MDKAIAVAIVACAAVVVIGGVGLYDTNHRPPPPTIEQSYAALQFDATMFKSTSAVVCSAVYYPYQERTDAPHYSIGVQLGDTCTPSGTESVYTYDRTLQVGQHVVLKMDTTGQWWARPVGKRF